MSTVKTKKIKKKFKIFFLVRLCFLPYNLLMNWLIVSDDLDIICFDVVSTPSVPMAYIETNDENLKPYLEEETKNGENIIKENVNDKLKEFENWLND